MEIDPIEGVSQQDVHAIRSLYESLLESWNSYNPDDFAELFTIDANLVGFDGSQVNGFKEIRQHLRDIFENHQPASFIGIIREVRALSPTVYALRAVAGMVPPGESEIHPELNSIHTLIATKDQQTFSIAIFQSTPAVFHGRPDLSRRLTKDLKKAFAALKRTHQMSDNE